MPGTQERSTVNIGWLIKLRWVAVIGQLLTIAGAVLILKIQLIIWPLLVVIGLTVVSNLVLIYWISKDGQSLISHHPGSFDNTLGLIMTMDMLSLTTLLFVTGGPTNPFCLFFFVNLSLSAVVLSRNWAWLLNVLSILCFAGLLIRYIPLDELESWISLVAPQHDTWSYARAGLLIAFATCSTVIVYFMTRITGELKQQEMNLRAAQESRSRDEKLEALGTLAAGAAHELATPLTTIALVAKDVEQSIRQQSNHFHADDELIEDVGLIRQELDRCKSILDRMASHAGETVGEMMRTITVRELYDDIHEGLTNAANRIQVQFEPQIETALIEVPFDALSQAVRGLIQNALDASEPNGKVQVTISRRDENMVWAIRDQGMGMTPDVLRRVSEPFFTTKQPGKGMGLGVFLARNVVERLDGQVNFQSVNNGAAKGTTVKVSLPCLLKNEAGESR